MFSTVSKNCEEKRCVRFVSVLLCILLLNVGCRAIRDSGGPVFSGNPELPNPMLIPPVERQYVMDQISDELDNYFRIYREERIRVVDSVMTEGWIETHPRIGGTLLEPWKNDSVRGFERMHATLQTVRRFAKARIIPIGNGYQIDVKVFKELEDLPQPIGAAVGGELLRHDNALDVNPEFEKSSFGQSGWIPQGRDFALEQQILGNLQSRFAQAVE